MENFGYKNLFKRFFEEYLEKTNSHAKADRMAAVRAEKMRHSTKAEYKRLQNLDAINDLRGRERDLLVMKHALEEPPTGTFGVPVSI